MKVARVGPYLTGGAIAFVSAGVLVAGIMTNKPQKCEPGFYLKTTGDKATSLGTTKEFTIMECYEKGERTSSFRAFFTFEKLPSYDGTVFIKNDGRVSVIDSKEHNPLPFPKVSEDELIKKVRGKKLVIFSDDHSSTKDNERFLGIVNKLDVARVGLEFNSEAQDEMERYLASPNVENAVDFTKAVFEGGPMKGRRLVMTQFTQMVKGIEKEIFLFDAPGIASGEMVSSPEREEHIQERISQAVDDGKSAAVFIGFVHATTAPKIFNWQGDEYVEKNRSLALNLKEKYGSENVVTVDLRGCYSAYIDYCLE